MRPLLVAAAVALAACAGALATLSFARPDVIAFLAIAALLAVIAAW